MTMRVLLLSTVRRHRSLEAAPVRVTLLQEDPNDERRLQGWSMRDAQATEGSDTAAWIAARIVELYHAARRDLFPGEADTADAGPLVERHGLILGGGKRSNLYL